MSIGIRPATLEDITALVQLNAVVQQLHFDQRPDQLAPVAPLELAAWFRELLPQEHCNAWVAVTDTVTVGYLVGVVHSRPATPFSRSRSWFEVDQLAVDPTGRNQGVGTALLTHALSFARANQIRNIELTTWAFNTPAQALFQKLGFVEKHLRYEISSDT